MLHLLQLLEKGLAHGIRDWLGFERNKAAPDIENKLAAARSKYAGKIERAIWEDRN